MKAEKRLNYRVVIEPRQPGDFGWVRMSGVSRSEQDTKDLCEQIASDVRRHVDNLQTYGDKGVYVEHDKEPVCEHCGSYWSEDEDDYNGGCCAKDEDAYQARLALAQETGL